MTANLEIEIRRILSPEQWAAVQEFLSRSRMTLPDFVETCVNAPGAAKDRINGRYRIEIEELTAPGIATLLSAARMTPHTQEPR